MNPMVTRLLADTFLKPQREMIMELVQNTASRVSEFDDKLDRMISMLEALGEKMDAMDKIEAASVKEVIEELATPGKEPERDSTDVKEGAE